MEAYLFFSKLKEKGWIFLQIYEELIHGSRSNVTKGQGKVALLKAKKNLFKRIWWENCISNIWNGLK